MQVDWLARREMLSPNKVALIDTLHDGREITYREWNRAANRTARFLQSLGVKKGDRIAVLSMNCVEYLDIWFACGKLGAILQNLNWRLTAHELGGLVEDAAPTILIYGPEFAPQVNALRERADSVRYFIALDDVGRASPHDMLFAERDAQDDSPPISIEIAPDDPWVICYTGGTTGLSKGAILTHGSITWNSINTVVSWGLRPDDVTILNAPLFHTGGLNVFTAPLVHIGGTSIVCRGFDPGQVYELMREYGVTVYFGVPSMFIAMQEHPAWQNADFSRLRILISGGAPCPLPVFERFWERGVPFKTGYGMTESGPNTFWLPDEEVQSKPGAVGYPLFHVEVNVVRRDGHDCAPDEVGELLTRGKQVCAGYWNRPEESAHALEGGWLHTGDLARRDSDGCHYIVGRLKEMIISGGENIYPAEVESVLAAHPAVATAALIGLPDPRWGEVGRAVIVLRPGCHVTESEVIEFCRQRLARYKVPKSVIFIDALPMTGAGKVDKRALLDTSSAQG
ncbi:MAG TPA: long-chain fatty acid--CoA ligase [Chloroflexia bacterium]|nr:long-chain fatty acid--CoA ligase [Chloroflexia bacterium]